MDIFPFPNIFIGFEFLNLTITNAIIKTADITTGLKYNFKISLILIFELNFTATFAASILTSYFSLIFFTKSAFSSLVIDSTLTLIASSNLSKCFTTNLLLPKTSSHISLASLSVISFPTTMSKDSCYCNVNDTLNPFKATTTIPATIKRIIPNNIIFLLPFNSIIIPLT